VSLTLGAGLQGAVHCRFEHAGQFLPFAPGSPGGTFWQAGRSGKEEARNGRGDRRAAVRDRVCGIDIGKAQMVATIRVPSDKDPSRRAAETRSFGTTKREVLALADWLRSWQVPAVVMEATGDYVRRDGA
jgi:hypothetical protein